MVKNAFKNLWKDKICLCLPMAIIYFTIIMAAIFWINTVFNAISAALVDVKDLITETASGINFSVNDFLSYLASQLEWNGDIAAFVRQFNKDFIVKVLVGYVEGEGGTITNFKDELSSIVEVLFTKTIGTMAVALVFVGASIIVSAYVTRFVLRRRNIKISLNRSVIAMIVRPASGFLIVFIINLVAGWFKNIPVLSVLISIALLLFYVFATMLVSWWLFRPKGVILKQVVTFKTMLSVYLAGLSIIALNIVLGLILYLINIYACILIMVPFLIYSVSVIDMNIDVFVCSLSPETENNERVEKPKAKTVKASK